MSESQEVAPSDPALAGTPGVIHDGVMAARPRGFETVRDMVLSMAVVGAVVLGLYLIVAWQRPEVQGSALPVVDVQEVVSQVDVSGPFDVRAPSDLPAGWAPTSAWFEGPARFPGLGGSVLHVGYVTPTGSYAEVKQTDGEPDYAVREWAEGGEATGRVQVAGSEWTKRLSSEGTKALTTTVAGRPEVLVVVTGKADWPELTELAASLQAPA